MRLISLVREALASAWASKVPTALIAIMVGAMCFVALSTVGKAAANEDQVRQLLAAAGARQLTITDTQGSGYVNPRTLGLISTLSTVDTVIGIGVPRDVTNGRLGPGGQQVAAFPIMGDLEQVGRLVRGRWPNPGEALVTQSAQQRLGLAQPVGVVQTTDSNSFPIVGAIVVVTPFEKLSQSIIVNGGGESQAHELTVVVSSIPVVAATQRAVVSILDPRDPQSVSIESPAGLADTAQQLSGQLVGFGRSLLVLILGVGAFFVAAVVLSDVLVRRRDLGRRRTLGSTRADLISLVMLRTFSPAVVGAVFGSGIALMANIRAGYPTSFEFACAVTVLAILTAGLATLPAAVYAAHADPVRVMRTP